MNDMKFTTAGEWMLTRCDCTHQQKASGNGCIKCNPEKAYDLAREAASKIKS